MQQPDSPYTAFHMAARVGSFLREDGWVLISGNQQTRRNPTPAVGQPGAVSTPGFQAASHHNRHAYGLERGDSLLQIEASPYSRKQHGAQPILT